MSARHRQTVLDYAKRQALPHAERMVLCQIADYIRRDDLVSFPGVRRLADDLGYTERYIQKILRRLERLGLLLAASLAGGRGYRTAYRIPGLEENEVRPEPPVIEQSASSPVVDFAEEEEKMPEQELVYCYSYYIRRDLAPEKREQWRRRIAAIDRDIHAHWLESRCTRLQRRSDALQAAASRWRKGEQTRRDFEAEREEIERHLAFYQKELAQLHTPEELDLMPVAGEDEELLNLEIFYMGLISLQAAEQDESKKAWWQPRVLQARADYNAALDARGIVAADGQSPPIDDELEEQLREEQILQWQARVADLAGKRDTFQPGSERWQKWNRLTVEASENLNGLLYQKPPPLSEYSPAT